MVKSNSDIARFKTRRDELNELVMKYSGKNIKRFYGLDSSVFRPGVLTSKTKELIGLVASMVLRCEDCINYHLDRCSSEGVTDEELEEALAIGLIVGGSVTIPELRRAFEFWDGLKKFKAEKSE
jgi:AhpD family alkylhydroperoxidase